jgi:MoxR-like ATPase
MIDLNQTVTDAWRAAAESGRTRAIFLSTHDRTHTLGMVTDAAVAAATGEVEVLRYHPSGRYRLDEAFAWIQESREQVDSTGLLRHVAERRRPAIILLEDATQGLQEEGGDPRARMLLADLLNRSGDIPTLLIWIESPIAARRLPEKLRDEILQLDVPYPRAADLERLVLGELARLYQHQQVDCAPAKLRSVARPLALALSGLTISAARHTLLEALIPDATDIDGALRRLDCQKKGHLTRELQMKVLDIESAELPIGLDRLTEYIQSQLPRLRVAGPNRARGVLLIGPPGTGQTMLARAIGKIVGLPVVEFRISALMTSLLGETEQRFARAFATLEAMAPNVVFIDEIEKAFGGDQSERDGGTMMRCTGALLSWLSDNPHPNFIVATSNSLARMGEIGLTMTRSERFDECFFVDVPGLQSREAMLASWLERFGLRDGAPEIAAQTARFSGADLRSIVKLAGARAEAGGQPFDASHIKVQVDRRRPRVQSLYDEFTPLRRWGRNFCDPASSECTD